MSVGPILPPPAGSRGASGNATDDVPDFRAFSPRPAAAPMSGREALLASLLIHALLAIGFLAAPRDLFMPGSSSRLLLAMSGRPDDERIPMAFVQDAPRPPEPSPAARMASDRDRRRGQEEQPPDPAIAGPFSRGNTPARIAEGDLGRPERYAPGPADAARLAVPPLPSPDQGVSSGEREPAEEGQDSLDAGDSKGRLIFAQRPAKPGSSGADASDLEERGARLRQALNRMEASGSVGGGGGAPYRFDNPTAGLSTPTGTLSFDTKGFDWGPYARRIYWIIWSNWHARMPPAIYTGQKGAVTVRFVIEKDGTLTGIRILDESGVPAYDSAAVLALEASNPLPPLPDTFPKESEGVTGRFLYNIYP